MRARVFIIAGLALAVAAATAATRGTRERVQVERGEIKVAMLGRAVVGPANGAAAVRAEVDGRVVRVIARVGDLVHAGDLLAELDPSTLEIEVVRRSAEARALSSTKLSVAEGARPEERAMAEAELAATKADLVFAEKRLARIDALVRSGSASTADADQEAKARSLAASRVAAAEARLRQEKGGGRTTEVVTAQARAEAAEAALRQAKLDLARTRVVAPIDGVVLSRKINAGDTVRVNASAFEIADVSRVEVRIEIGEDEEAMLAPGLPSKLLRGGKEIAARGHVSRVSAQLEARSVGFDEARLRGDARVRVAWIELDEPPPRPLLIGQVFEAEIQLPSRSVAARLPRDAVKVKDGRAIVEVPWGPFTRERAVRVGIADDVFVETIGLDSNTTVLAR